MTFNLMCQALCISLEEERAHLTVNAPATEGAASTTLPSIPETTAAASTAAAAVVAPVNLMDQDEEDEELARVMLFSQGDTAAAGDEDVEMGAGKDEEGEGEEEGDDEGCGRREE